MTIILMSVIAGTENIIMEIPQLKKRGLPCRSYRSKIRLKINILGSLEEYTMKTEDVMRVVKIPYTWNIQ